MTEDEAKETVMSHAVSVGYQSNGLAVGEETTQGDAVAATNKFEITSETFDEEREVVVADGLSGARSQAANNEVEGKRDPKGGFTIRGVRYASLLYWMEFVLGNYASGSAWLSAGLSSLTLYIDKVTEVLRIAGAAVNEMTLESSADEQALRFALEMLGMSATTSAITFPSGLSYPSGIPLVHRRCTLKIGDESTYIQSVRWRIANNLDPDGFRNSQTRITLEPQGNREVGGELRIDWNSTYASRVWDLWRNHNHGTLQTDWTDGTNTVRLLAPCTFFRAKYPGMADRNTVLEDIPFECKSSAAGVDDEVQVIFI